MKENLCAVWTIFGRTMDQVNAICTYYVKNLEPYTLQNQVLNRENAGKLQNHIVG